MSDELSKNDLFILMESYKNNIQLNTTLLEQQKQMLSINNKSIESQKELLESFNKLIEKLNNCSKTISDNHNAITTQITAQYENLCKDHLKINQKFYVAFFGMISIVLSVVSLAIVFADKYQQVISLIKK